MLTLENTLSILEKYKLTPTELFTVKLILLAKEDGEYEYLSRYNNLLNGNLRTILKSLQNKFIILKSWKLPKEGELLEIESIPFNQNFQKQYFRASFEMGQELFETYPQSCIINGQYFNLRRISKKFDSLEDAFSRYGKYIKNNPETHKEILNLIRWGIDNNYGFTTLDSFIINMDWKAIKAMKNGEGVNINTEAIKMI